MADPIGFEPDPGGFTPDAVDARSRWRQIFDAFAQPATAAVGRVLEAAATPFVPLARMAQGEGMRAAYSDPFGTLGAGGAAQQSREQAAKVVVPQTPLQAGIMAGTLAAGPVSRAVPALSGLAQYPALTRILGGTLGGAAGGAVEQPTLASAGRGAAIGAGTTAAGELIGKAGEWAARVAPGGKAAANEEAARRFADVAQTVNPDAASAIATAKAGLNPALRGAKTPAALQESVLGGGLHEGATAKMRTALDQISQAAGNPTFQGGVLEQVYKRMPEIERESLGAVGPNGFTLPQAQLIRGWLGDSAFSQSPIGQGVSEAAQKMQWNAVTKEIAARLGPQAPAWQAANREYGGIATLIDALKSPNAFTGGANRIALNTPAIQQALSMNRLPNRQRMGPEAFQALADAATGGGQLGTRDILAPGFGGAMDALRQVYGRGQGGAPQILGSALRTVTPNIGSQYTGAGPLKLPPAIQQIIDLAIQRQTTGVP